MTLGKDMIVGRKEHIQYVTDSKSYSADYTCSLTERNLALNDLYYGPKVTKSFMKFMIVRKLSNKFEHSLSRN